MPPEALFLEVGEAGGGAVSPEVFPRPNGTTYVCAISSESPLPVDPAEVVPDPGAIDRLTAVCRRDLAHPRPGQGDRGAGLLPPGHDATGCR